MKILLITDGFPPMIGGTRTVYSNICKNLNPEEIVVLTAKKAYLNVPEVNGWKEFDPKQKFKIYRLNVIEPRFKEDIHHMPLSKSILRFISVDIPHKIKLIKKTLKIIKKHRITHIICGELNSSGWLCLFLKKYFNKKYICYIHGEEITQKYSGRLYGKNRKKVLKNASLVIAVSDFTAAKLKQMGINPNKIKVLYNGVDLSKFYPKPKNKLLIKKYNLKNKKVLMTIGRLDKRKNHENIIKALPQIFKKIPNLVYIVVGDGSERKNLENLTKQLNLQNHIIFTGYVDEDLSKYYNLCDLFIMPNITMPDGDTEGFGIVFLEANACKKPVIGGDSGGTTSAIINNKTGFLIDGNNLNEITEKTILLLKNKKLSDKLAENGYKRAKQFEWKSIALKFKKIIQNV